VNQPEKHVPTTDGVNQYLFDGDGRICAVASTPIAGLTTMTGYLYGADGTRVSKGTIAQWSCDPVTSGFTPTNDYVLGLGGEQVTEMAMGSAVSGTTTNAMAWQHTNVYAAGQLIATYDGLDKTSTTSTGGSHFYLDDWLGTRRVQTDYAGVVEQTCQSWPFGDQLACTGSTQYPTEHHFTGKERDAESGNDYFGARYFSSSMGRFLSPDWSAKEEPVPYAKLDDPQTLNLYDYVRNNPLSNVDADGHACSGVLGNTGSGFCTRATEYGGFDANPTIQSQTRFFAAANAVSQGLADVDSWRVSEGGPASVMGVSTQTATFLEGIGQKLEQFNEGAAQMIVTGNMSGPGLDQQMVHNEQTIVQGQLDGLQQSNPDAYTKTISEINGALNPTPGSLNEKISSALPTDAAFQGVLGGVRKDLGRNIDFSKQGDREAIGNALIKHIRQTGGCDVNGKKQAGC
jgi:RHS repeat-associated protein